MTRPSSSTIGLAVLLVAVPTLFSVFPEWTRWPIWARVLVMAAWVGVAVLLAIGDARHTSLVQTVASRLDAKQMQQLTTALDFLLLTAVASTQKLIEDALGTAPVITVYVEDERLLRPLHPKWSQSTDDVRVFEVGKGATGTAFERGHRVAVKGPKVYNGDYGLTDEQRKHFKPFRCVVAEPILSLEGVKIGVVTVLHADEAAMDHLTGVGGALLERLAANLGVILSFPRTESPGG